MSDLAESPDPVVTDPATDRAAASTVDVRPGRLVISLFGLFVRTGDHWISVAALIRLMAELGVSEQAVRSSVSRLKRRGVLISSRPNGAAGYSPSAGLEQTMAEGDRRIFGRDRAEISDGWVTVSFSVPEQERRRRHELRSTLAGHGFGIVAPGMWIAPGTLADEVPGILRRRDLRPYATIMRGQVLDVDDDGLRDLVAASWNLTELSAHYQQFIDMYDAPARDLTAGTVTDREAFSLYVPMVTGWRRLPYLDPGLPLRTLPQPWPGARATELFHRLHAILSTGAARHASAVMSTATSAQA